MNDARKKFALSFIFYTLSIVLFSVLATLMVASQIYGQKVKYMKFDELEKKLQDFPDSSKRMVAISKYILPAVVNVTSIKPTRKSHTGGGSLRDLLRQLQQPPAQRSSGSGFVIDKEGHIVTNHHVVGNSRKLYVTFINRQTVEAVLVGSDPKTDIALLKIQDEETLNKLKKNEILQVTQLGTSRDIAVAEWVLAVGNPFALNHSISFGIISAVGRSDVGIVDYENFIQTDAAINPGNSGGPLVSVRTGKVIGINTAIMANGQGIGFAIPIDIARDVIGDLKKRGVVRRGYLGASIQDMTDEMAYHLQAKTTTGALVTRVVPESPAAKGGLKSGDVIVQFNGQKISRSRQLRNLVATSKVGSVIHLLVDRTGKKHKLEITLGDRRELTKARPTPQNKVKLGVAGRELTPELAKQYGYEGRKGVLLEDVTPGSLGWRRGLRPRQLVVEVNRKPIRSLEDFEKALHPLSQGKSLLIKCLEGDNIFYTIIRPPR